MLKTYLKVAPAGTLKRILSIIGAILQQKEFVSIGKSLEVAIVQNVWKHSPHLAAVHGTEKMTKMLNL